MTESKLFFALWPSRHQRERLHGTIKPLLSAVEGNPVSRRNWHVTLVFIGNFPAERIPELLSAAQLIDAGRIRVRFDSVAFWQRPKIACLQAKSIPTELEQLVRALQKTMIPFGYAPETRVYRPHITVARKVRAFEEIRLARPIELTWSAFELVESVPVAGGVRYHPLKQ